LKVDVRALVLRLTSALFLFSMTLWFLYLVGAAQGFLESTQLFLFQAVRWSSWVGLLGCWFVLVPWNRRSPRLVASLILGLVFGLLFGVVLVWGSWIYPKVGVSW